MFIYSFYIFSPIRANFISVVKGYFSHEDYNSYIAVMWILDMELKIKAAFGILLIFIIVVDASTESDARVKRKRVLIAKRRKVIPFNIDKMENKQSLIKRKLKKKIYGAGFLPYNNKINNDTTMEKIEHKEVKKLLDSMYTKQRIEKMLQETSRQL